MQLDHRYDGVGGAHVNLIFSLHNWGALSKFRWRKTNAMISSLRKSRGLTEKLEGSKQENVFCGLGSKVQASVSEGAIVYNPPHPQPTATFPRSSLSPSLPLHFVLSYLVSKSATIKTPQTILVVNSQTNQSVQNGHPWTTRSGTLASYIYFLPHL